MEENHHHFLTLIKNNCTHFINQEDLINKLNKKKSLTIKLGADPSAPDIHLGHYVVLKQLRAMQDLGHRIVFLIGDFTGMIGDPTGKNKTRKLLSREEVLENAITYKKQIFKVLDEEKTVIRFNSEWHLNMPFAKLLEITSRYTLARLLERDDFALRFEKKTPITLTELLYPLVQGYDSVALEADIEVGGSDQLFNLLVGRNLQKEFNQEPQVVLTFPLLEGLDGKNKMSKSLGNYISFNDSAKEIFGKTMSLPDSLIIKYFKLLTNEKKETIETYQEKMAIGKNPRDFKILLAKELVKLFYDPVAATTSEQEFLKVFSQKQIPTDIPTLQISEKEINILELIQKTKLFKSKGEIRRIIEGGGIAINQKKVTDDRKKISLTDSDVIKIGKKYFYKIKFIKG